ncbi:MCE family protein [Acidiferrimicrobium sp. IK]|uniref:MCE family protein n=1 Tax=Acidiferrimicrobium sp. IK TaxID=2871700 RepID=UPI0021CAE5A1|nr:MCE family protein [Acidiferrimicrobium sp. IK]MCU4186874.1 MCE family protein [Acidiferrimicrobium sp. IK]
MSRQSRFRWAGFAAAASAVAALVSGCGVSLQSLPQIGGTASGYRLNAVFANVQNLAPNAEVREGDAVIGRVTSIKARDYQALVGMTIQHGVDLPAGTTAEARFSTPLGDEFIALTVPPINPGHPRLRPGATLSAAQTRAAPSVADTFAALAAVLYGGGLQQAESVVSELNQVLGGRGPEIGTLLSQLNSTVTSLASNDASIDHALRSVGNVAGQLDAGSSSIVAALNTLPVAAQTLEDNTAALHQLLAGVNKLTPAVTSLLQTSGANLIADSKQLAPVSLQLAGIQDQIGRDLTDVNRFLDAAKHVAPAGYAQAQVDFVGIFPGVSCTPHLIPAANPAHCNPLNPQSNYVPPDGLSTDSSSQPAGSSQSSGALDQLGASVP